MSFAAGVGLNLTRANNVISLDLAWSRAVESQAWDRVHRLGQIRSVNVQRLVIAETVEDRIMALQERKVRRPVAPRRSMAESDSSNLWPMAVWGKVKGRRWAVSILFLISIQMTFLTCSAELTVRELANLFGLDDRGRVMYH